MKNVKVPDYCICAKAPRDYVRKGTTVTIYLPRAQRILFIDDVKDRAKQVVADVKDEAIPQGLKSAAGGIGEKFKTVAGAGRDSVAQRFAEN